MKATCDAREFGRLVQAATRATSKSAPVPIVSGLHIEAVSGYIVVMGTDLQLYCKGRMDADVATEGTVVVDHRYITPMAQRLAGDTLSLETDEGGTEVRVESGRARYTLKTLPGDEYPVLEPAPGAGVDVEVQTLASLFRQVVYAVYAVGAQENRPALSCIELRIADGRIEAAATDGSRLAWAQAPCDAGELTPTLVDPRWVREVSRLSGVVTLSVDDKRLHAVAPRIRYSTQLVQGTFPDYHKVLAKQPANPTSLVLERQALLDAVARMGVLAAKGPSIVVLDAQQSLGLTLRADESEVGKAEERLDATMEGPDVRTGFQAGYLMEPLQAWECERVRLTLEGELGQARLTPADTDDAVCILMPVRLHDA